MTKSDAASWSNPIVSVVIPTREAGDKLVSAVKSVVAQTYLPTQVVIAGDGTDPPRKFEFGIPADIRVQTCRTDFPSGAGAARNRGLQEASGELIAFLDDDDEWYVDHLEHCVNAFRYGGIDVGLVQSGYEGVIGSAVVMRRPAPTGGSVMAALLKEPILFTSAIVVRKAAIQDVGPFDTRLFRHQDWDLWIRILSRWRYQPTNNVTVARSIHDIDITAQERLAYHREIRRRIEPHLATLPILSRTGVRLWHARTSLVRKFHVLWARKVGEASWQLLRLVRRRLSRGWAQRRRGNRLLGRY